MLGSARWGAGHTHHYVDNFKHSWLKMCVHECVSTYALTHTAHVWSFNISNTPQEKKQQMNLAAAARNTADASLRANPNTGDGKEEVNKQAFSEKTKWRCTLS